MQHEVEATGATVNTGPEGVLNRVSGKIDKPFTVIDDDNNYVSGRWPGDSWALAELFIEKLKAVKGI